MSKDFKLLQINKKALRAVRLEAIDDSGRIPVIFSTETPTQEATLSGIPYKEIFDHSEGNIDTSAIRAGGRVTLFDNHQDGRKGGPIVVLGSVTDITFDYANKVGRGFMEFADTQRGQDAKKEYTGKHRAFVSIGAHRIKPPLSITDDPGGSGQKVVRWKWKPIDVSAVNEPGDINARAFRAQAQEDEIIDIKINSQRRKNTMLTPEQLAKQAEDLKAKEIALDVDIKAQRSKKVAFDIEVGEDKAKRELARHVALDDMGLLAIEGFGLDGAEVTKEVIRMKAEGIQPLDFRAWMIKKQANSKALSADKDLSLGLTGKEQKSFGLAKALRAMHEGTFDKGNKEIGFELEVSEEAEKLQPQHSAIRPYNKATRCLTLPRDITHSFARRADMTPADVATFAKYAGRSMSVDQATKGGAWTAEGLAATRFIDYLNAALITDRLNITRVPGLTTDLSFAVLDGIQTAYMRGEHEAATLSDLTTSVRKMSPRLMSSGTKITNLLSIQGSALGIDALIERKLALAQAILRNQQFLYGTGVNKEALGIMNNTGVTTVAGGTNGLAPTQDNYINMRTAVAAGNAMSLPGQPSVFLCNSVTVGKNQRTAIESGQTDRITPTNLPPGTPLSIIGHAIIESNLLRSNLTKGSGTALSECAFINPQEVYEGTWGMTRVLIDDKTAASTDETITYIHEYLDYMLGHAIAVSIMNDLITT